MAVSDHCYAIAICLAVTVVLPACAAEAPKSFPLSGTVDSRGTVNLTGTLEGEADSAGVVFSSSWRNGTATASFQASDARILIVNDPFLNAGTEASSPVGQNGGPVPLPEQLVEEIHFSGKISVRPEQPAASIQFRPNSGETTPVHLNESGAFTLDAPDPLWYVPQHASQTPTAPPPSGRLHRNTAGIQRLEGAYQSIIFGAKVTLGNGTDARIIHSGKYPHQPSQSDPYGYSTTGIFDQFTVIIYSPSTVVQLEQDRGGLWNRLISAFKGTYRGDLAFTNVAETTLDARFMDQALGLVQAIGDFQMEGKYQVEQAHWSMDGTATFLGINGSTIAGQRNLILDAVMASIGLGLLATLGLILSRLGSDFRFLLWGHNKEAQPLAHPTRLKMLDLVGREPGIAGRQLMERLRISRPSLAFHARVLERGGYIESYKHGTRQHFAPRAGVAQAAVPVVQRALLTCLNHPIRSRILACFQGVEPISNKMIHELMSREGPTIGRTLIAYHMGTMERDGILLRMNAGSRTKWVLNSVSSTAGGKTAPHHSVFATQASTLPHSISSRTATSQATGES